MTASELLCASPPPGFTHVSWDQDAKVSHSKSQTLPLEFYSMKIFTKREQSPARDLLMTVHILEIKYR